MGRVESRIQHPVGQTFLPRAMLAFLAREWSGLTTLEQGRRLPRDPSMISRLATAYAAHQDAQREKQGRRELAQV